MKYKYIFGPVQSRRLGLSLGVDLVPHKTCSLDCVYCECGKTTKLTLSRKAYVPARTVIKELKDYLSKKPILDCITFSGAGEPLLNSGIKQVAAFIKKNYPVFKTVLLTNSTLIYKSNVTKELKNIDIIIPSLDAVSQSVFKKINRPHNKLISKNIIEGLIKLREQYKGIILLEVFIVPGLNDTKKELALIKSAIKDIHPDKVQINTLDRPGTEAWVRPASLKKLKSIAKYLGTSSLTQKSKTKNKTISGSTNLEKIIIQTIRRRPSTLKDLSAATGLRPTKIQKYIANLKKNGKIVQYKMARGAFYTLKNRSQNAKTYY